MRDYGWYGEHWIEWHGRGRTRIDARAIIKTSEKYAQRRGIRKDVVEPSDENPYRKIMLDHESTIVCLKPIVVVMSGGRETEYLGGISLYDPDMSDKYVDVTLGRGFKYGTRLPYSDSLTWFSPDMKRGPLPVEIDSEGVGRIELSWGRLVLTREGNEWVVTTSASK